MAATAAPGASFNKIIQDARNRRKYETLADRIFGSDRRQSASPTGARPGSLASRAGVKKRVASSGPQRGRTGARPTAKKLPDEWTHDLHPSSDATDSSSSHRRRSQRDRRNDQTARLTRAVVTPQVTEQAKVIAAPSRGISIRGQAGPFIVVAENFAPGTSVEDIEAALNPGSDLVQCAIVQTAPVMVVEMVFATRDAGDSIIERFDNEKADGRILKLYHKNSGSYEAEDMRPPSSAPRGPRARVEFRQDGGADSNYVDGTMGFAEPMERDVSPDEVYRGDNAFNARPSNDHGNGAFYSDVYLGSRRSFDRYRPSGRGGR